MDSHLILWFITMLSLYLAAEIIPASKHWELLRAGLVYALTNKCVTSDTVPVTDLSLKKALALGRSEIPHNKFNISAGETMRRQSP